MNLLEDRILAAFRATRSMPTVRLTLLMIRSVLSSLRILRLFLRAFLIVPRTSICFHL
jgi:hypothetical protein